jgi:heparan-alpha-glucosaminide N-acetyltransferase
MTALLTRPLTVDKPVVEEKPPAPPRPSEKPPRLVSLDAYRGFIMLLMASSGLYLWRVAQHVPSDDPLEFLRPVLGSGLGSVYSFLEQLGCGKEQLNYAWYWLAFNTDHVPWLGGGFWDMIQPAFMFMVGVAIPYSYASRKAKGQSEPVIWFHTIWRAFLLVAIAVFLTSPLTQGLPVTVSGAALGTSASATAAQPGQTNFMFTNVLAQIGLGYCFVYLLRGRGLWIQLGGLAAVLIGSWLLFFLYPLPGPDFDYAAAGTVKTDWGNLPAWFAHWDKNANAASAFDRWFLNLFPRRSEFLYERGGYTTLNFLPSMATMILGLMAGELLRAPGRRSLKFLYLVAAGVACLLIGLLAGEYVCPIVKRIWTPSWAVYSSGWTFLMLAAFYGVIDLVGWKRWALPLTVVGMNSIAIYCMSQLMRGFLRERFRMHLPAEWFGGTYGIVVESALILLIFWLVCAWMYRRGIFLRI